MLTDESKTLGDYQIKSGFKILIIGSSLNSFINTTNKGGNEKISNSYEKKEIVKIETLSEKKEHKKIVDKGVPTDALQAIDTNVYFLLNLVNITKIYFKPI
jgi:hypothetical protein